MHGRRDARTNDAHIRDQPAAAVEAASPRLLIDAICQCSVSVDECTSSISSDTTSNDEETDSEY